MTISDPVGTGAESVLETYARPLEGIDVVYREASEWVRLANTRTWILGTVFIPLSFLILCYTATHALATEGRIVVGLVSIILYLSWAHSARAWGSSARKARDVLCAIENHWNLPPNLGTFQHQDECIRRSYKGLGTFQITLFVLLALGWLYVFAESGVLR